MTPKRLDAAALRDHPLPPVIDGDKETKGKILIIAGSREVPGAALLTATAAMRTGAGKLRIATDYTIAVRIGIAMPEAMVIPLPADGAGALAQRAAALLSDEAAKVDAVRTGKRNTWRKRCIILVFVFVGILPWGRHRSKARRRNQKRRERKTETEPRKLLNLETAG